MSPWRWRFGFFLAFNILNPLLYLAHWSWFLFGFARVDWRVHMFLGIVGLLIGFFILKKTISFAFKVCVIALVVGGVYYVIGASDYAFFEARDNNAWKEISDAKIDRSLVKNKVVLVTVTADWCWACKLNEYITWSSRKFADFVKNNDIVIMKGDLTAKNKALEDFVRSWGNALPLTILYSSQNPSGRVLNSIITPWYIAEEIEAELSFCARKYDASNFRSDGSAKKRLKKINQQQSEK